MNVPCERTRDDVHRPATSRCAALVGGLGVMVSLLLAGCGDPTSPAGAGGDRVLLLGIDGMDPQLLQRYMEAGDLPHLAALAAQGDFKPLATSMPPQSPVAWSNCIAGADPGVHQIYDFLHRDPATYHPYLSTSKIVTPAQNRWLPESVRMGQWQIPMTAQEQKLLRRGPAFWDALLERDVPTVIYRMPANYPAESEGDGGPFHCLTGMGTPDVVLGSYGRFTVFSPDAPRRGRTVPGGHFERLRTKNHRAEGAIEGPPNHLRQPDAKGRVPETSAPFTAVRDPQRDLVKITLGDSLHLLAQGEWSDWIQFDFQTGIPGGAVLDLATLPTSVPGMVRFYVKEVHPDLVLFATPINIDPQNPANPISIPDRFAADLAERTGLYFTAGIPEHTPEVQQGGLDEAAWLAKVYMIHEERLTQFRQALRDFERGALFFYVGTVDQICHIFWRDQDPQHPGRDPEQGDRFADAIRTSYVRMDEMVGEAMKALGDRGTLVVMSDHGFCSFRRGFNLNTWLMNEGYLALRNTARRKSGDFFENVDWSRTQAYGVGLNGLYVNQRGRERDGIVDAGPDADALVREIAERLLTVRDDDGTQVVWKTYVVAENYPQADPLVAPDLLVGYARNYRVDWSSMLGGISEQMINDNTNRWSGDHCIAAELVPGILVANRPIAVDDPRLTDIGPSILGLFGIPAPSAMVGRPLFTPGPPTGATR